MYHIDRTVSLEEAARADCALWRGGQESLSLSVTGSPQTLRHKLTGHNRAILGVQDAVSLMELTGGRNLIAAMASQLGGLYVPMPAFDAVQDNEDLMLAFMSTSTQLGELARKAQAAVSNDGVVDMQERAALIKSAHELNAKVMHYLALLDRVYGDAEVQAELRAEALAGEGKR
ncbi:phage regulatory CII family protein [Chitinibacter fontanus]|uniref:Phage regulatory CII family protein n=1 Tax=Chitinibacter fontanus TaxID=1737446 RepID=A0A7D5V8R9_9NEIS|nr:phage regulatory CII family protein [Chitinibacter fontanus]QLI80814.1 phage regulatory CII family protein [Chitinibacter fontanus]